MTAPLTPFEQSGSWTTTPEQVETFLAAVDAGSPLASVSVLGQSVQGRNIPLVSIGHPAPVAPADTPAFGSLLVVALQHGHERGALEGALKFLRDVAFTTDPDVLAYLAAHPLFVVPCANPDGLALNKRENADDIDLNRDHLALVTPEASILAEIIRDLRPGMIMDLHEGASTYDVELAWGAKPVMDPQVRAAAESAAVDNLIPALQAAGIDPGLWPTAAGNDERLFRTAGGLRGIVAVLAEVNPAGGRTTAQRTATALAALEAALAYHAAQADTLAALTLAARSRRAQAGAMADEPFDLRTAIVTPPPTGYLLTNAELATASRHLDLFGVTYEATTEPGYDVVVTMAQAAQPLIPYLLDPAAPEPQAVAVPQYPTAPDRTPRLQVRGKPVLNVRFKPTGEEPVIIRSVRAKQNGTTTTLFTATP